MNQTSNGVDKNKEDIFLKLAEHTPAFVYFESEIETAVEKFKNYHAPHGLQVRYAMKANSNLSLLKVLDSLGLYMDASSFNECYRGIAAGISPNKILLTSQEIPSTEDLKYLVESGVEYNACSLLQLENYGRLFPHTDISVRFNTGKGSSYMRNTSTGGKTASFGIYEQRSEIKDLLNKYNLTLRRVHIHIGSAAKPKDQVTAMTDVVEILKDFPTVTVLNMGGGFKVARVPEEPETDIASISQESSVTLENFCKESGRDIKLEIEPGTGIIANAGYIVSTIKDIVDTGSDTDSINFIKVNTGMAANTRVAMYGAQHPIYHIPRAAGARESVKDKYVVVGECCESSDILTCVPNKPAEIREIKLNSPQIGDLLIIGGSGAYCSAMSVFNYQSKQQIPEFLVRTSGDVVQIRKRQSKEQVWQDDILVDLG